jgi:hypothetical protein
MKIYIAAPYSAERSIDRQENTYTAIHAGLEVFELGHFPFIPHLTHYVDRYANRTQGFEMNYEDYIEWDKQFLHDCDALLHLDNSPGADHEREVAEHNKMIIYESVDEIPHTDAIIDE